MKKVKVRFLIKGDSNCIEHVYDRVEFARFGVFLYDKNVQRFLPYANLLDLILEVINNGEKETG